MRDKEPSDNLSLTSLTPNEQELREQLFFYGKTWVEGARQLYIDIDVEADGKPGHGSLLSIGAISPHGEKFYCELKPASNDWVPSQRAFCEQHGLPRDYLLKHGLPSHEAILNFVTWTNQLKEKYKKPPVFTAFNAGFDFGFIDLYCLKAGIDNPYGIAPFDLKSKAQDLNREWDWSQTSKDKLPKIVIPDGDFTHNALEDAIYQQKIHFALAGLSAERIG